MANDHKHEDEQINRKIKGREADRIIPWFLKMID